jgi:hypothetical protein
MFNKNFYPTPPNIIEKMAQGLDLKGAFVLEPSAGKATLQPICATNTQGLIASN